MTIEAQLYQAEPISIDWVADAAHSAGDVVQLRDGRAGVVSVDCASGDKVGVYVEGIFLVQKTTGIVILDGGRVCWDFSAGLAHFKTVNDRDFFLGSAFGDAASAATTLYVNLNVKPVYAVDLANGFRSLPIMTTLGSARIINSGSGVQLTLGAANEAQKGDALSYDGFAAGGAKAIVEFRAGIVDGDASNAADFNVGIASATHATDADSIAQHLFMHIDGNSTAINFQSKDGTTTVAATDSTKVYTAGTAVEVWFDLRNPADVQIYVDGVNVLPATVFDVSHAASTWKLLAHLEKTATTDTGNMAVDWLRARLAQS